MNNQNDIVCVILAGGQGKRMASTKRHKVCFPILGRPAVVRLIDTCKAAGISRFIVVVGQMAEQVIATITEVHPEVSFVHQPEPRGTGHAAAIAADALAAQGHRGAVMIIMGDKVTRPPIIRDLLARFEKSRADVVLATLPKQQHSTAGRVVTDSSGRPVAIIEVADIQRARRSGTKVRLAGRRFTAAQVEKQSHSINASTYIFRFEPLREALGNLRTDSAQGELYLTDTVEYLAQTGRKVETMLVPDPADLMAYNTPEELLAVEQVVRRTEKPPRVSAARMKRVSKRFLKPASKWLKILQSASPRLRAELRRIYGQDEALMRERREAMGRVVRAFIKQHGPERPMVLCRAPGRINLMGRHVDHRGGYVNVMAISREVLLAAAPREDDVVTLRNLQTKQFPPRQFRIGDLLREASWADWMDFLASRAVQGVLESARGDWSHYARAPLLRLQHECRHVPLKGMDCIVSGNIPMGAGLSSSSALVVAFAEAAVALNGLNVAMHDFVDLCGEGEWFVGSRGGSADHAAIRTSRPGYISKIGFFPFRLAGQVRFPPKVQVVIANSGLQAVKSAAARDVFNQRVASYELAEMMLRRSWPAAAGIEHLRDLAPTSLKVRPGEIYRALARLPVRPSRRQLRRILPVDEQQRLQQIFATHSDLGGYDLRGVALFGISECLRSDQFASLARQRDLQRIGQFMKTSHDGDRRVRFDTYGRRHRHTVRLDNSELGRLADADADLTTQCGRYGCSTEAIDNLVDIACATEGVVGGQLAGAGLGGCMMVLVRSEALGRLLRRLKKNFYEKRRLNPDVYVCVPVAGAGLLAL